MSTSLRVRRLGDIPYVDALASMREFTKTRDADTEDELWLLQHPPVFTQGQAGKEEHLLAPGDIPVVSADRGGQVTYHGPGQWVVYVLVDLKRRGLGVRDMVSLIENAIITVLAHWHIDASADPKAPGVYVNGDKIASLGLRISRGCSYHGLALNVDMDLEPFSRINPCGFTGLKVTSMARCGAHPDSREVGERLLQTLEQALI